MPHDLARGQPALDEGQARRDQDSEQQSHDTQRPAVAVPLEEELNEDWNGGRRTSGAMSLLKRDRSGTVTYAA